MRRAIKPTPKVSRRYLRTVTYTVVREATELGYPMLDNPATVAAVARQLLPDDGREHFAVVFLDSQNRYTGDHHVSTGTVNASLVHPREVLGPAIREGAVHLVLVHNHPSGDPKPSKEDIVLTGQLIAGAKLLGLTIHDHVIVGSGTPTYVSLAATGQL